MTTLADVGGWPALLGKLVAGEDLFEEEASAGLAEILSGDATAAQIAAFVVALRAKGETATELAGLLTSVLDARVPVVLPPDVFQRRQQPAVAQPTPSQTQAPAASDQRSNGQ